MFTLRTRASLAALSGAAVVAAAAGCSAGTATDGKTTISYLVQTDKLTTETATAMIEAFEKANPDIAVELDTQPAGTEGDNLTKTKLSTGEMSDVFFYNTGSLLQALNPDDQLVDLSGESWVEKVNDDFLSTVSTDDGIYGAPNGSSLAGGVLYNKKVYASLGLEVPTSWAEFLANGEEIKRSAPDVAPILQAYGDDWTAQLFVLADFANVLHQDPEWATKYTDNEAKYSDQPAFSGFLHQQEAFEAGLFNEDFASLLNDEAIAMLAEGSGAHYPILTSAVSAISQNHPDSLDDVGFFALPADDATDTQATVWQPNALYIPRSTEGAQLEAAKKLVEFIASSQEACEILQATGVPSGPYVISTCELPADAPAAIQDLNAYFEAEATAPALEFLSPVKGPSLPNITIEVGSGIRSAEDAAALYDEDVKKQAQQLGLEGW
ncbi:ABC transporter substrate-binding protein [Microbacterium murale]|uniref:Raffinose/stachyose/melibiose transport system substrate-binding protein n=1 Tax=Microbacterium murale TaxID=1081040 RepID=A0ABU0PDC7_9MICO|nr:extracellular solute-binding protein [Microbacterium murale]MDQ0645323.1 raffinose/stachyose/melibiose transport system substrate-binding protein [Microbacterium murale]